MGINTPAEPRYIRIIKAREHNLQSISIDIPRDSLVVFTGLSGSGKSSLAFDTIYAEGQRRYIESLSVYARQFLDQLQKPDVEEILGLTPTIAIEQRTSRATPRSTVATMTEIYDYLRLLCVRLGVLHCPQCHKKISQQSAEDIVNDAYTYPKGTKLQIFAPVCRAKKGAHRELLEKLQRQGFSRVKIDGELFFLEEAPALAKTKKHNIDLLVDRVVLEKEARSRIYDSVETALKNSAGLCVIYYQKPQQSTSTEQMYSEFFACPEHGTILEEISPRVFSFNSPYGACADCFGLGSKLEPAVHLVIPNPKLSMAQGAIAAWKKCGSGFRLFYPNSVQKLAKIFDVSVDQPWEKLDPEAIKMMLHGGKGYEGILNNLKYRFSNSSSDSNKSGILEFMSDEVCPTCKGSRLRSESLAVIIEGKNIADIVDMNVQDAVDFINNLPLLGEKEAICRPIISNLSERLNFLIDVGLNYLKLNRLTRSLSGGEFQRIKLASHLGAKLSGVTYVLDEPTIGLHQHDNQRLIGTLKKLKHLGNSLIVVEHDEDIINSADFIVDIGPEAGIHGGQIVASGSVDDIINSQSLTGKYLSQQMLISDKKQPRSINKKEQLVISGCKINNLKNLTAKIPLGLFCCISGVSGAGKSSLVIDCIAKGIKEFFRTKKFNNSYFTSISGLQKIDRLVLIDQSPIGKTPRSNPVTYTGVFDHIRKLFAKMPEAIARGYKPARFSFNVKGGRCEACNGQGSKTVEMHFLPNVEVICEVCKGKRYNSETLQIKYKAHNIAEVLDMSIEDGSEFFKNQPHIQHTLTVLNNIGLGYIKLGQSSTTLSGGESQRMKLCSELTRKDAGRTLYIMDEPTTGLHFHDIAKLIKIIDMLVENNSTVLVIEHNLDVLKAADWIIDVGPSGGDSGGYIVATGNPQDVANNENSLTGQYLKQKIFKITAKA